MNFKPNAPCIELLEQLNAYAKFTCELGSVSGRSDLVLHTFAASRGINVGSVWFHAIHIPYDAKSDVFRAEIRTSIENNILTPNGLALLRIDRFEYLLVSKTDILGKLVIKDTSTYISISFRLAPEAEEFFNTAMLELFPKAHPPILRRLEFSQNAQFGIRTTDVLLPDRAEVPNISALYPYFQETPAEVWEGFSKSTSNVLMLIGPPGVGKSSFILEMMKARGWELRVYLADSDKVIMHPQLTDFVRTFEQGSVMITEDSDTMVGKREDGNSTMSALLNATSGIIPTNVKIIISTNLTSLNKVDQALLRPGRTFKVLQFKNLSVEQAVNVRSSMNLEPVDFSTAGKEISLAEAINWHETIDNNYKPKPFGMN
jgi:hypothetical protein